MSESDPTPTLTPEDARTVQAVILEQERMLRYGRFGADEAFELGSILHRLVSAFPSGYSATITRESDGVRIFQWVTDDKAERNLLFADGKRQAARAAGHASPWAQLEAVIAGNPDAAWAKAPDEVPACGAFPIRVGDDWVATLAVSGLHDGLDHEVILRALEQALGVVAPRWEAPVA